MYIYLQHLAHTWLLSFFFITILRGNGESSMNRKTHGEAWFEREQSIELINGEFEHTLNIYILEAADFYTPTA